MEIKKYKVNGKKVFIVDDVLEHHDILTIYRNALNLPFKYSQVSDDLSHIPNTRFAFHMSEEYHEDFIPLWEAQHKILKKLKLFDKLSTADVYVNLSDCMTPTLPHTDRPKGCWTMLYYANSDWDIKYSGATNFIHNDEIVLSCAPKPGRFAVFQADILHQALPPTFYSPYKRVTIPFKMDIMDITEVIEEQEAKVEKTTSNTCW